MHIHGKEITARSHKQNWYKINTTYINLRVLRFSQHVTNDYGNTWEDNLLFGTVIRFTVLYYCYIITNAARKINMDIIRNVIKFRAGICICIKFTQRPLTTAGTMKERGKYVCSITAHTSVLAYVTSVFRLYFHTRPLV